MAAKELVIKDWQSGIAESSYMGFSQMKDVDIFTTPGALKIAQKLVPSGNSAAVVSELIIWWAEDPATQEIYGLDRNGNLYKKDLADTWTVILGHGGAGANGNGLGIWKNYLFYARDTRIDVYGPLTGGIPGWIPDWKATAPFLLPYNLLNYDFHPFFSRDNGVLVIGNANFVDTLEQVAGQTFNPNINATWLYNAQDLELDYYYRVTCLEKLGVDSVVGTEVGVNNNVNTADMFFWDGSSNFFDSNKTIRFAENGVWQVKNNGNTLCTVAGTGKTRLFASTTSVAQEVKRFNNITLDPTNQLAPSQGAIDLFDGELLIGVGKLGGSAGNLPLGVYSYRNSAYALKHTISSGEYGVNDGVTIGAIKVHTPTSYLVSYYDITNATFGVDVLSSNFYNGAYEAQVESAVYQVGTDDDPTTYEKCEIRLGKPLRLTDKVRISLRQDLNTPYTIATEFLGSVYTGGRTVMDAAVKNIGYLKNTQVKVELDTGASEIISPELISVTLR